MLTDGGFALRQVETYEQDRPLSAYTKDVDPADVAAIDEVVAGLTERQRHVLNAHEANGEMHLRHFYVTLVADRV